jgi:hypothetical protein
MTRSARSMSRHGSLLTLLCCAAIALATPALAADPAPEPAPTSRGPTPEPAPGAKPDPARQATTRVSPPANPPPAPPPPATPPAPAATPPPPPVFVQPPPAVQPRPAAQQTSTTTPSKATPKEETTRKNDSSRAGDAKGVVKRVLPPLVREKATSPDTMLLVGGIALFVLILADTVFLTLSARVLRVR